MCCSCSDLSGGWMNLSATSVGVAQQDTVSIGETFVAEVHSTLVLQDLSSLAAVRCEATNSAGRRTRDLRMESVSFLSQVSVLVVVLVLFIIALIFLILLIVLWRKKPGYEVQWKLIQSLGSDGRTYVYRDLAKLPYSPSWEIPRDQLVLGEVLGSGAFGRVVDGSVFGLLEADTVTRVTVKMVKGRGDAVQALMSELRLLVHLGPHLNLVNLLGVCSSAGPFSLITEFCCHGDLLTFLRRNQRSLVPGEARSVSDGGYMDMNQRESDGPESVELQGDAEPAAHDTQDQRELHPPDADSAHLSLHDLFSFSYQVCHALDFLSARQCVHTDLAARNVLVCEENLVKLCDFGLARDLMKHEDYDAHGNALVPLRWWSPETIFQKVHSSQSLCWSFGVLLWEIFTLGCRPYGELKTTKELLDFVRRGNRLSRPKHASQNTYSLMKQCWTDTPQSRPSFSSLADTLASMLSDSYKQSYGQLTEEFLRGNNPAVLRSHLTQGNHVSMVTVDQLSSECPVKSGSSHSGDPLHVAIETSDTTALDAVSAQKVEEEEVQEEESSL